MDKISCDVIQDLLPLYCDDICSEASREFVEQHLQECSQCAGILEKMKTQCRISHMEEQDHDVLVKDLASAWRRSVKKSLFRGAAIALCLCLLLAGLYWALTRMILVPVPKGQIVSLVEKETEDVVELSLKVKDGKRVLSSALKTTEDGKCYIIIKRGIVAGMNGGSESWNGQFGISKERMSDSGERVRISEIYYGTEKDHVLLWEEGRQ